MMLLEYRNTVKTATELRAMVADMDKDNNKRLSFLEWCCAHYGKSYDELDNFVDEEARERAMAEAMAAGEEAKRAEEEIERAKQQKELQASLRAAALERESKMVSSVWQVFLSDFYFYYFFTAMLTDWSGRYESFLFPTSGRRF